MRTLSALLCIGLLMGCSKNDDNNNGNPNTGGTDPLQPVRDAITGVWQGDRFGFQFAENGQIDSAMSTFEDLDWQYYTFNANGTMSIDSAGTTWGDGNWALISSDKIAVMSQDALGLDSIVLDIHLLNSSRFEMQQDSTLSFGGTTYSFQTFLHLQR